MEANVEKRPRRYDVLRAMRAAVVGQVMEFKALAFEANPEAMCPLTGELLTWDRSHVDHEPPDMFVVLARRFLAEKGVDIAKIKAGSFGDGKTKRALLVAGSLCTEWEAFHRAHAKLRLVSPGGHVALHRDELSSRPVS